MHAITSVDLAHQLASACPTGSMWTCTASGVTEHRLAEVLGASAAHIARSLDSGASSPVAISLPHGAELLAVTAGTWASGNVIAPISLRTTPPEIRKLLAILQPSRIVCEAADSRFELADASLTTISQERGIKILVTRQHSCGWLAPGDAWLATTSGTTGEPKCAVLSASAILANCLGVRDYLNLAPDDRVLVFTLPHFTYAVVQLLSAILADTGVLAAPQGLSNPQGLTDFAREYGVTGMSANPTAFEMWTPSILQPLSGVRYVLSAGQPLRQRLFGKLEAAFPSASYISGYGCTENINRIAFAKITRQGPFRNDIAGVGWPIPGTKISLEPDTGEIILAGSSLMRGYLSDLGGSSTCIEAYHTGDIGLCGESGELYLVGRISTRMNVGNEMVDPEEVEAALLLVPGIADCAVGPVPDDLMGDAIGALIVLDDSLPRESFRGAIGSVLTGVLRRSRWPQHIRPVANADIPRTAYGKIDRRQLKRQLEALFQS